jgi:ADP-ribose pyrophosphatase YjhB (NUDIX family)
VATVTPGAATPASLDGIALHPWSDAPTTLEGWASVPGQCDGLDEEPIECPADKEPATGVVVVEDDGRMWVVCPTNGFGGRSHVFPKGRVDDGLPYQANAIKEAFEESGLQVEIHDMLGDFERTTTVTRYYLARRVGGTPSDMGWESQAVRLAPPDVLRKMLSASDHQIVDLAESLSNG